MITIIIPAHNESAVIERCLRAVAGAGEVIVVCNGCTDDTAAIARACRVRVIETPIASKAQALNLGDAAASGWPRFYVDADIVLEPGALAAMARRLEAADVLAVAPRTQINVAASSWGVRAFYKVDRSLPWSRDPIGGAGVYGISQRGRSRWGDFPQIIADDGFVHRQFARHERALVSEAVSIVTAPSTMRSLIAIKTRSHFGTYELEKAYEGMRRRHGNVPALMRLALRPTWWPALAVYGYVKVIAKSRARWKIMRKSAGAAAWERDESSRTGKVAGAAMPVSRPGMKVSEQG